MMIAVRLAGCAICNRITLTMTIVADSKLRRDHGILAHCDFDVGDWLQCPERLRFTVAFLVTSMLMGSGVVYLRFRFTRVWHAVT